VSKADQVRGWYPVIGLEVHCQLRTATKMFSGCGFRFGKEPNSQTDAYSWGLPGTLPVPNRQAVEFGIRLALAAGCEIQSVSRFARKHYFYPDLPKGYQITQSDHPYATGGRVVVPAGKERAAFEVRLIRIHFEEDAGKNTHVPGENFSLVDYNRAGAPLLEIVSEPDIRAPADAAAYLRELRAIIRYLDLSEANMEEGTLRCDANVSLRRSEEDPYGTRCEIKNLNSFKFLEEALHAEILRQADLLESGQAVIQSTLSYDTAKRMTKVMRTKEEAADYRYFPEPDLPPLQIDAEWVGRVKQGLPKLPAQRREEYQRLGLNDYDAAVLTADPERTDYFDATVTAGADPKQAANWVSGALAAKLNAEGLGFASSPVSAADLAAIIEMVADTTLSIRTAKDVLERVYAGEGEPAAVVEAQGYRQVSDTAVLEQLVREVLEKSPAQVEQYRQGKTKVRGFFVGQVMKETKGQANPAVVNQLLDQLLPTPEES
jgi:aspartyl-tRNA(Asn)/glutamyl-tRNA(Gln) amidotransferase subunit B